MDETKKMLTPEDKATLKEEINQAIETTFAGEGEMTREELIDALISTLSAMKGPAEPTLGGLGEEAEGGMKLPEEGEEE